MENSNNEFSAKIFGLFQTDIEDLLRNKFQLMIQDTKAQTNVVDSWYYWMYEEFIKYLNEKNKEETEQQKKQQDEHASKVGSNKFNPSSVMKQFNPSTFMKNFGSNSAFPRV